MKIIFCATALFLAAQAATAQIDGNIIAGRLLDAATGQAVTNVSQVWVQVGLVDPVSHRAVWNDRYLPSTVTRPRGEFVVMVPKMAQELHVLAAGYQSVFVPVQGFANNPVITVRLTRSGGGPGVVLDASGQPVSEFVDGQVLDDKTGGAIADYVVQSGRPDLQNPGGVVWDHYTMGDKLGKGRFSLPRPTPQRMWRILAPGHVPQELSPRSVPDISSASPLLIRLKPGGELHGVVVDDAGRPVAGARVMLGTGRNIWLLDGKPRYGWSQGGFTSTDEAGRFELPGEGEISERLVVISPDNQMVWPVIQTGTDQDLKITLAQPGRLLVRYDIPGDATEAKVDLTLIPTNQDQSLWKGLGTDLSVTVSNGVPMWLTNLTPGNYHFRRWKTADGERGAETASGSFSVAGGRTAQLDLVRTNGQRVSGQVLGLGQAGAAGGLIFVRSPEATGQAWPQRSRNEQKELMLPSFDVEPFGADGTFQTATLKPGTYSVIAHAYPPGAPAGAFPYHPDFVGVAKITVADQAAPPVTIQMEPTRFTDIIGHVVDDATGRPIPDVMIQFGAVNPDRPGEIIWSEGYQGAMMGGGAEAGKFDVRNVKAGAALRFRANGYVPQVFTRETIMASRQAANLQVRLKRGGELHGVVLDHAGQPVAHAKVYLCPVDLGFVRLGSLGSSGDSSGTVYYWAHTFAATDRDGHFSLRGVDGSQTRLIVATDDGQMVWPVPVQTSDGDLKITLPEPATLVVRYDIPGDVAAADFSLALHTNKLARPPWQYLTLKPEATVANGGQTILTNLLPGTYDFSRTKFGGTTNLGYLYVFGDPPKVVSFDPQTIVLKPGQTQHVDLVRATGQRVRGRVAGLAAITNAAGAFLYIMAADAIKNPGDFLTNNPELCHDAVFLGTNEWFQTALLKPGNYTLVAEVYAWRKPSMPRQIPDDEPQYGDMMSWGNPEQLAWVGSTNLTVTAGATPPVNLELHPWVDPR